MLAPPKGSSTVDAPPKLEAPPELDAPQPGLHYQFSLGDLKCQTKSECALVSRGAGLCPEPVSPAEAAAVEKKLKDVCSSPNPPKATCGPMPGCIWQETRAVCHEGHCAVRYR